MHVMRFYSQSRHTPTPTHTKNTTMKSRLRWPNEKPPAVVEEEEEEEEDRVEQVEGLFKRYSKQRYE